MVTSHIAVLLHVLDEVRGWHLSGFVRHGATLVAKSPGAERSLNLKRRSSGRTGVVLGRVHDSRGVEVSSREESAEVGVLQSQVEVKVAVYVGSIVHSRSRSCCLKNRGFQKLQSSSLGGENSVE